MNTLCSPYYYTRNYHVCLYGIAGSYIYEGHFIFHVLMRILRSQARESAALLDGNLLHNHIFHIAFTDYQMSNDEYPSLLSQHPALQCHTSAAALPNKTRSNLESTGDIRD